MLPKQYAFNLRHEKNFFSKARRIFSRYCTLFYIPSDHFGVTVVVPKKAARLATKRNWLKRQIKAAAIRVITALEEANTSFFVVLVAKSAAVAAPREDLFKELFSSLKKVVH